ncbi:ead/Ea22-like family protein [Citrobacter freundii]|nr:ead/Ea22-like family protein [Citrobacter freundii]
MTALNKQALREVANTANIASWGKWESYKPHKGARGYEVRVGAKAVAQHCLKVDSAFIAAANPSTVLALLDELEAAEKRIGELEARAVSIPEVRITVAESRRKNLTWRELGAYNEGADVAKGTILAAIRAAGIGVKGD